MQHPKLPENRPRRPAVNARAGRRWYDVKNASGDVAEIFIYDEIAFWGTTAAQFVRDLGEITAKTVNVRINSPGGDVFDAAAIHNALRRYADKNDATIEVDVDGLAASAASVIAMAGDTVRMGKGTFLMIHDPWAMAIGNAVDMRQMADTLDQIGGGIASVYAARAADAGLPEHDQAYFLQKMSAETWYDPDAAVAEGLADKSTTAAPTADPAAAAKFDLSVFAHVPAALKARAGAENRQDDKPQIKTVRDAERLLRDAGLPIAAAKAGAPALFDALSDLRDEDAAGLVSLVRSHVATAKKLFAA